MNSPKLSFCLNRNPEVDQLNPAKNKATNLIVLLICFSGWIGQMDADDKFKPDQSKTQVKRPQGSIVLFNGKENLFLNKHGRKSNWPVSDQEIASTPGGSRSNHIVSKWHFRDADIHVEFKLPEKGPGNSGIYIHGNYEFQIFNSFGRKKLGQGDCGALYGFQKPLVNACRKPGEWQVVDIRYVAPRRNKKQEIVEEGKVTAWLNGQLVLDQVRFGEPRSTYHPYRYNTTEYLKTIWSVQKKKMIGPLFLQDHGNPVVFRNVWIKPLDNLAMQYEVDRAKAKGK